MKVGINRKLKEKKLLKTKINIMEYLLIEHLNKLEMVIKNIIILLMYIRKKVK